jgi:ammonia channel protein AmtB
MIGGIFCFFAVDLKKFYAQKYDDACDVLAGQ